MTRTYTIYVCPKHGVESDPLASHQSPTGWRCRRLWLPEEPAHDEMLPLEVIEVVPRAVADELAEALEAQKPAYTFENRDARDAALTKYREAVE